LYTQEYIETVVIRRRTRKIQALFRLDTEEQPCSRRKLLPVRSRKVIGNDWLFPAEIEAAVLNLQPGYRTIQYHRQGAKDLAGISI
jgi:hypothetical protein